MSRYKRVRLSRTRTRDEHRLIMEELLGVTLPWHLVVHHKNGDALDNRIENLEVLTRSEHSRMHKIGTKATDETKDKLRTLPHPRGSEQGNAKLDEDKVLEIRRLSESGCTERKLALLFGVGKTTIHQVLRRETWGHL